MRSRGGSIFCSNSVGAQTTRQLLEDSSARANDASSSLLTSLIQAIDSAGSADLSPVGARTAGEAFRMLAIFVSRGTLCRR